MKAPKQFTRQTVKVFAEEIMDQIGSIEGVNVEKGSGTFGDAEFTMKVKFTLEGTDFQTQSQKVYELHRHSHDLPAWGFKFKDWDGNVYEMVDYKARATKFPVIGKKETGSLFKFSINQVKKGLIKER